MLKPAWTGCTMHSSGIMLAVPEVLGIENWVTSNLPLLFNPSSITKIQS